MQKKEKEFEWCQTLDGNLWMFFLCALRLSERVEQRRGRARRDRRVLRANSWEEEEVEEEEEEEEASQKRGVGVLWGRCHGDDLSSNCQGGPLGKSWRREETTSAPHDATFSHLASKETGLSLLLQKWFPPSNLRFLGGLCSECGAGKYRQRKKKERDAKEYTFWGWWGWRITEGWMKMEARQRESSWQDEIKGLNRLNTEKWKWKRENSRYRVYEGQRIEKLLRKQTSPVKEEPDPWPWNN